MHGAGACSCATLPDANRIGLSEGFQIVYYLVAMDASVTFSLTFLGRIEKTSATKWNPKTR